MTLPLYSHYSHWKDFYPLESFTDNIEQKVEEKWIASPQGPLHLDIYRHDRQAPTVVYCHGLSSCGRMMANFALRLHQRGFNVICPDLPGFGLAPESGTATVHEMAESLVTIVDHAPTISSGPVYLTGISLGGSLSYYAAAAGAKVTAIACLNLMDLGAPETLAISERGKLLKLLKPLLKTASAFSPRTRIPLKHFVNPDKLCDHAAIVDVFKTNPLVVTSYTLRSALSLLTARPTIPFEKFDRVPVLVLHGARDRLIPESLSRANFERIAGLKKYVSLPNAEHIPLDIKDLNLYADTLAEWFQTYSLPASP